MAIEIKVTPEDIDILVKDALMKASFGKTIQTALDSLLKANSYNNPVEAATQSYLKELALKILHEEYGDKIKAALIKSFAAKWTEEHFNKTADQLVSKFIRDLEDR